MKQYLNSLDPRLLRRRIGRFWELDFAGMSHEDVSRSIYDVLTVNGSAVLPVSARTVPAGAQLLRVRHVPSDFVPAWKDCWAPPSEAAASNRLNRAGEPWLYTSVDLDSAFSEMPVPTGMIGMLMVYKAREDLQCSCPGFDLEPVAASLTRRETNRLALATQFLRDLFSLEVSEGEEYLYKLTQCLVADFVDYPNCVGVCYPGVKSHGYHVALKAAEQGRLRLSSVKMMDSVCVRLSTESDCWKTKFRLLRSYDENLAENTRGGPTRPA